MPASSGERSRSHTRRGGLVLLAALALRADAFAGWTWGALLILMFLFVSFRSTLVWACRKAPSRLGVWIRLTPGAKGKAPAMWLVYAVVFGAASVLIVPL